MKHPRIKRDRRIAESILRPGPVLFVMIMLLFKCAQPAAHLRQGPGTDYFRPEFECHNDSVNAERDVIHMVLREMIRQSRSRPSGPPALLIAGESTMSLFPEAELRAAVGNASFVNHAIGGETTVMLLSAMDEDIIAVRPSVILLSIGGNDILGGRCLSRIRENVALFLFKVHTRLPATHVILAGVPPIHAWRVNSVSPYLNMMLSDLATENASFVEYFDLWEILADPDRPVLQKRFLRPVPSNRSVYRWLQYATTHGKEEGAFDYLHFNEAGYREVARGLRPRLERLRSAR